MPLPDANAMIASVPGDLRVEVADAEGVWHDAVLTYSTRQSGGTDYGLDIFGGGDTVYVAKPFVVPPARLRIRRGDQQETRKIVRDIDHRIFRAITVGEAARNA